MPTAPTSSPPASAPPPREPEVPLTEISDLTAVAEVVRGNREMFEAIVRRHNPRLFRVGMAYLRSHAQAEDAMQNAYLKAFLNLRRFQRGATFSTWLTRIMINECLMVLRRHRLARSEAVERHTAPDDEPTPPTASETMNLKEMKALLEQAIATLPQNYRVVYVLREVQQLTTAETAACLGITTDTVKVRLLRARERLKAALLKSAAGAELFPYPAVFCDRMTTRVLRAVA